MDNRLTLFPGGHDGSTESSIRVSLKRKTEEHESKQPHPVLRSPEHFPVSLKRGVPWGKYKRFVEEDQAGRAIVAMDKHTIVAVKEHKITDEISLKALKPTKHTQLVNLLDVFVDRDVLFLIYEDMDASHVSLGDIEGGMSGSLKENEIAAIAEQVMRGLEYIHETLRISHGNIDHENLLVTGTGQVKIANIANGMFQWDSGRQQQDMRSFGLILRELMELGSEWTEDIRSFQDGLDHLKATSLMTHNFVRKSTGPASLIPHVRITVKTKFKTLRVLM